MKKIIKNIKFDKIDIILSGIIAVMLVINICCSVFVSQTLRAETDLSDLANAVSRNDDYSATPYYQDIEYLNQLDFLAETLCVSRGVLLVAYPARYFYLEAILYNMSATAGYREDGYIKLSSDCLEKLADNYFMSIQTNDDSTIATLKDDFYVEKEYVDSLTADRLAIYKESETDSYERYLLQTEYDSRTYTVNRVILRNDCDYNTFMYRVADEYVTYVIVFDIDSDGVIHDYSVYR